MHICLILAPGFPVLTYVLLREVISIANAQAGQALFSVEIRTVTGAAANSIDGIEISPDRMDWSDPPGWDLVILCAGAKPLHRLPMGLRGFLARAEQAGATLAGFDGGVTILAALGYLDGYQAVHPNSTTEEEAEILARVASCGQIFSFDRGRLTAKSGLAAGDALLAWIARVLAPDVAKQISDRLSLGRFREDGDTRHLPRAEDPVLARMQSIMVTHLGDTLPLTQIAFDLDLSPKQLRLRCRKGLGQTPTQVYLKLRLDRAEQLVRDTVLSVEEVAQATGFTSPSAFTRSFKSHFGAPPRVIRKTAPDNRSRPN
ncbi:GlxA family transcriptional regulator [Pelagimonas varians]|uniref:HTH-type transcriptional regulator CdhR n=1 Tax=Pelagimonas varians TaxID=696760 RepID=A0A238K7P6_9RHOB|nr:helix-turn-helix domain-containing protein [Pelagimonas varians]PYG31607.1 AraC family carnitine catabolism transcriptional activator [Pelagimonas varians]SMX38941.1 HTH-type transcriptional regulator CdhR [Pelagimonas varians]